MSSKNVNSVSGPDAVEARATRESIGWVPVLFGFTIFVMLSTPMAFALTSGVDPYSIYMTYLGFGTSWTVFLPLIANLFLTLAAVIIYLVIKWLIDWVSNERVIPIIEHGFRASISAGMVFAVPIAVAYNDLKPYYLIAWVLTSVFFGLMGGFAAQGSTLDRLNMTIYMVSTVAIGLAFAGAGLFVLYFEDVAQFPPPHNGLTEFDMAVEYEKHLKEKGDDLLTDSQKEYREWVEDFPARHSNGRLIFGWVTIPYVFFAFVLGMWRATYEAWRRGSEGGAPDASHPDPVEEVTHDQNSSSAPKPTSLEAVGKEKSGKPSQAPEVQTPVVADPCATASSFGNDDRNTAESPTSTSAPLSDDDSTQKHTTDEWRDEVETRLKNQSRFDGENLYRAKVGSKDISFGQNLYNFDKMFNRNSGCFRDADILVDDIGNIAYFQTENGMKNAGMRPATTTGDRKQDSLPYRLLCIFSRNQGSSFTVDQLESKIDDERVIPKKTNEPTQVRGIDRNLNNSFKRKGFRHDVSQYNRSSKTWSMPIALRVVYLYKT